MKDLNQTIAHTINKNSANSGFKLTPHSMDPQTNKSLGISTEFSYKALSAGQLKPYSLDDTKQMKEEHFTRELNYAEIRSILQQLVEIGMNSDSPEQPRLLFGFAWGEDFGDWKEISCQWDQIQHLIDKLESNGDGQLGHDDLFIRIGPDEIQFCHHSDIHFPTMPQTSTGQAICTILKPLSSNSGFPEGVLRTS